MSPFWSIKPGLVLLLATLSTQIMATFIVVYGFLMAPIGWRFGVHGLGI